MRDQCQVLWPRCHPLLWVGLLHTWRSSLTSQAHWCVYLRISTITMTDCVVQALLGVAGQGVATARSPVRSSSVPTGLTPSPRWAPRYPGWVNGTLRGGMHCTKRPLRRWTWASVERRAKRATTSNTMDGARRQQVPSGGFGGCNTPSSFALVSASSISTSWACSRYGLPFMGWCVIFPPNLCTWTETLTVHLLEAQHQ